MARPICEYFFGKALADNRTGLEREAKFVVPAEMGNSLNSADILLNDLELMPGAEGEDMGVGSEEDYKVETAPYIGPESTPIREEDTKNIPPAKKDTLPKKETDVPRNTPASNEKGDKKKGLLNRILKKNE